MNDNEKWEDASFRNGKIRLQITPDFSRIPILDSFRRIILFFILERQPSKRIRIDRTDICLAFKKKVLYIFFYFEEKRVRVQYISKLHLQNMK